MNKDRKLPPQKLKERRRLPVQAKPRNKLEIKTTAERLMSTWKNIAKVRKKREFYQFFFFPRAEFVDGEIGPAANEMRSTTPKSAGEWALGL